MTDPKDGGMRKGSTRTPSVGDGKRVLVGMSGGLDSTYAALYLRERGYTVHGAILRMTDDTDTASAALAAEQVGVPLTVIDARAAFDTCVMSYFASAYARGETPNPCVMCNRHVKVALLCEYAEAYGFDYVSTGHYAHILRDTDTGRYYVRAGEDPKKDQSYMLWGVEQRHLARLITPLAHMEKSAIRQAAAERGLSAAEAADSQDICFLPEGDYVSFVEKRLGTFPPGDFIDEQGAWVGRHSGIIRYTVGQRKGLGIALGHPVFVTRIDPKTNTVHVAPAGHEYGHRVTAEGLVFQKGIRSALPSGTCVRVKVRYAAPPAPATLLWEGEDRVTALFDAPARAITPGQSCVFYDGDTGRDILFGGWIQG